MYDTDTGLFLINRLNNFNVLNLLFECITCVLHLQTKSALISATCLETAQ